MLHLSNAFLAGRRLLTSTLQLSTWAFSSPMTSHFAPAAPRHSSWTMQYQPCIFKPGTVCPSQHSPRSFVWRPAYSPRLHSSQRLSVPSTFKHRPREAAVAAVSESNRHAPVTTTVQRGQQQLYISPAAYRRSRRTSTSGFAAQLRQHPSNSSNDQYVAAAAALAPQQQQQQPGIRAPITAAISSSNPGSRLRNHSLHGIRSRSSGSHYVAAMSMQHQQKQELPIMHAALGTTDRGSSSPISSNSKQSFCRNRSRSSSSCLSPAQHRARIRTTSSLLPLPDNSSTSNGLTLAVAGGSAGAVTMQQQQQQQPQQAAVRPRGRQRTRSISVSRSAAAPQLQQQQQLDSSDGEDPSPYQQQPIPPELLQQPPAGPLQLNVTAMLSWSDGSPPGLEKWANRQLPIHLDRTELIWVSVYQPGGPGSSAAIWVGETWFETSDASRSDHAISDHIGSASDQRTLDSCLPDQISNAASSVNGILLSPDLICYGPVDADVADQQQQLLLLDPLHQQQQQEMEEDQFDDTAAADLRESCQAEQQQQQQGRRRQLQLQPPIPPVQQQQQLAAAGPLWLEVQQRPNLGSAPAAVVEGLTFARHSRVFVNSNSSSSSSEDLKGELLLMQGQHTDGTAAVAAVAACALDDSEQPPPPAAVAACAVSDLEQPPPAAAAAEVDPWYDYLLLVNGDFSVLDHENMFPNAFVHCSDGRTLYNARSAADVAAFVAEAEHDNMQAHIDNLLGYAWESDRVDKTGWVFGRVRDRWGVEAMVRFGVDWSFLNARLAECCTRQ